MLASFLDLVASDVAPSPGSIAPLVGIVLFFVFFGVLGFLYLKKMRAQRIDALATELDRPTTSDGQALPAARLQHCARPASVPAEPAHRAHCRVSGAPDPPPRARTLAMPFSVPV